jgi:hypothetical protein
MTTDLFELERKLVPYAEWWTCGAPPEAVALATGESALRVPTGIAHDPILGWVVIQSSGQGPYIIWQEGQACHLSVDDREQRWLDLQSNGQGPYLTWPEGT